MKLIAGLGNPGKKYSSNRHNIGFMAIDYLGEQYDLPVTKLKFQSMWEEIRLSNEKVLLIKPLTFMNRSGHAIKLWMDYLDIDEENLLVIHDDLDLSLGQIKMRPKGGTGGHNGLKSIVTNIGTKEFSRLRFGIGRPEEEEEPAKYVLQDFSKQEMKTVNQKLSDLVKGVELFCTDGITEAMNHINVKQ